MWVVVWIVHVHHTFCIAIIPFHSVQYICAINFWHFAHRVIWIWKIRCSFLSKSIPLLCCNFCSSLDYFFSELHCRMFLLQDRYPLNRLNMIEYDWIACSEVPPCATMCHHVPPCATMCHLQAAGDLYFEMLDGFLRWRDACKKNLCRLYVDLTSDDIGMTKAWETWDGDVLLYDAIFIASDLWAVPKCSK